MKLLRVSSVTRVNALAGAIAKTLREDRCVDVRAIGAGAVNQAVKAIALANEYLKEEGKALSCVPSWSYIDIEGRETSAIIFEVSIINGNN